MLALISFVALSETSNNIPLQLKFTNIQSNKGNIIITVYETAKAFEAEKPLITKAFSKSNVRNGVLTAQINLPKGTYGIAVLDDENKDQEMNYTLLGMPTEGFGFANYYHTGFSYPKFEDFQFQHNSKEQTHIVKLRYLSF
jgi:uncharacterized protein (DUF2141 family)